MEMEMIKFDNKKAYEAYKFIKDTCDSNGRCTVCPFFIDSGCVLHQEHNPTFWKHAKLECDESAINKSVLEAENARLKRALMDTMNESEKRKIVAEERLQLIKELQEHIANLDETICTQEEQLSESYDASHIKVRDEMIFSLEKQLSDAINEAKKWKINVSGADATLAMKDRYIAKLEQQIANVKEALKDD